MPDIDYHIPKKKEPHSYLYRRRQFASTAETTSHQRARKEAGVRLLDASTGYAVFPEGLSRLAKENPDATIFFLLRDPIERAKSHLHWIQKVERRCIPLEVQLNLAPKKAQYSPVGNLLNFLRTSSYYSKSILHARKLFSRVHLIYFNDFTRDQSAVLAEIREILGLPELTLDLPPLKSNSTESAQKKIRKRAPLTLKTLPKKLFGAVTRLHHFFVLEVVYRLRFGTGTVATEALEWTPSIERELLRFIAQDRAHYEEAGIQLDKFDTLKKALND